MAEEQRFVSRRRFGKAVAGAAAATPLLAQAPAQAPPGASQGGPVSGQTTFGPGVVGNYAISDTIRFGGIGIRNRGMSDLRQLLGDQRVRFVAIADIRESQREQVKSTV